MRSSLKLEKILFVDDSRTECEAVLTELRKDFPDLAMEIAHSEDQFLEYLDTYNFELLISAYSLSWTNGFEILSQSKHRFPHTPVVLKFVPELENLEIDVFEMGMDDFFISCVDHFHRARASVKSALNRQDLLRRTRLIEKRNQEILRKHRIGFFQSTADGHLLNYDDRFKEQMGIVDFSQEEIDRFFLKLFEDNHWRSLFSSVVLEKNNRHQEFCIEQPDGEEHWFFLTAYLNALSSHNLKILDGLLENISHKKKFHLKYEKTLEIQSRLHLLSPREREVMNLVVEGKTNKRVAQELEISAKTVEMHRRNFMKKLHADSLADIVRVAVLDEQIHEEIL